MGPELSCLTRLVGGAGTRVSGLENRRMRASVAAQSSYQESRGRMGPARCPASEWEGLRRGH